MITILFTFCSFYPIHSDSSIYLLSKIITPIKINTITIIVEIHKGDKTHIQDQLMCFVNFNPMNNIVSIPTNPIPSFDEFSLILISFF